jgi:filamentous hemagglutinin
LILRGANAGSNRYAQLGFYTPAGGSSSGLIFVDALNVSLIGGATAGASNGAQIGHGEVNNNPVTPGILVSTLAGAAINVNAVQNITLSAGNNACPVFIGHGAFRLGDGAGANQNGDITVTAGGQITLNTSAGATGNSQASIGHGTHQANDAVLGAGFNATGNIIVRSVGPLTLNTTTAAAGNHSAQIGHFGYISGSHIATAAGDIDISCGDLTFTTGTSFGHSFIGHHAVRTDTITGIAAGTRANYRILVNGNLLMTSNTNLFQAIGYTSSIFLTPVIDANLLLLVNGNLTMTSTFASTLPLAIGFKTSGNNNTTEYIGVGGNISVTANHLTSIETSGDVVVAAGGSVTLTGSSTAGGSRAEIGTDDNTLSQTIIRAKGDVLAINGSVGGAFIGQGTLIGTPGTSSVEVRAGGDIQFAQNYVAIGTGSIFIEADSNFCDGGELWTNPMGTLTALGGQPLPAALQINANLPPLFQTSSTAQIYDQNGAFRVTPPAGTPLRLSTVSGNITLNSADTRADGATLQDLIIGTAAGQTQIDTTSGNIRIFGSVCPLNANPLCPPGPGASEDSFNNITITAIADPWTSGSILVSANNDLTVNDTVHTTGVANCITLRADNEDDGTGVLTINQNLTTNNGEILLDSGFNAPAGTSSILQTLAAVVDSNGGAVTFQSVGNTTISGGVNSVTTDGGAFIAHSQRGDVIIDENVLTTTGAVGGNATVTADLGSITLGTGSGTGGSITSATGNILLTAGTDINIQGQPTSLSSSTGFIHSTAGRNTTVSQQVTKTGAGGDILMISGVSMFIVNTTIAANAAPVTFVVDNAAPNDVRPNVGPGIFSSMGSFVNSGPGQPLRIFTALQQLGAANNQIFVGSLFNGVDPYSAPYNYPTSPIFTDTPYEVWCVYFSDDPNFPYPIPNLGFPFTIFYKPCLQRITVVANTVVSQLLFDLNPPDEWNSEWMHPYYPPYIWKFMIGYDSNIKNFIAPERERYWLSHKHLQLIHQPRVYKTEDQLETLLDKISKK